MQGIMKMMAQPNKKFFLAGIVNASQSVSSALGTTSGTLATIDIGPPAPNRYVYFIGTFTQYRTNSASGGLDSSGSATAPATAVIVNGATVATNLETRSAYSQVNALNVPLGTTMTVAMRKIAQAGAPTSSTNIMDMTCCVYVFYGPTAPLTLQSANISGTTGVGAVSTPALATSIASGAALISAHVGKAYASGPLLPPAPPSSPVTGIMVPAASDGPQSTTNTFVVVKLSPIVNSTSRDDVTGLGLHNTGPLALAGSISCSVAAIAADGRNLTSHYAVIK